MNSIIRRCRRCETEGFIPNAIPVAADGGRIGGLVLIGQAPGVLEQESGLPFSGTAGKQLFRWFATVGIAESDFRKVVYLGAVTRCFPGKSSGVSGDRRPTAREIEACQPLLELVLDTLRPRGLILVGGLAIERFIPGTRLSESVGHRFSSDGRLLVPLPHPSGASRWLNSPDHKRLLASALVHVRAIWEELALDGKGYGRN